MRRIQNFLSDVQIATYSGYNTNSASISLTLSAVDLETSLKLEKNERAPAQYSAVKSLVLLKLKYTKMPILRKSKSQIFYYSEEIKNTLFRVTSKKRSKAFNNVFEMQFFPFSIKKCVYKALNYGF